MRKNLAATAAAPPTTLAVRQLPLRVPLPLAPDLFGLSRSALYRAHRLGKISMTKLGRSTLVDSESVLNFLNSLPAA